MTSTEFWLAWLFNLRSVFGGAAVILGIASFILMFLWAMFSDLDGKRVPAVKTALRYALPALAITSLLGAAPSADDLWRLRVNLLKLDVASPENVKAIGGHVEEVVKALECKHLQVNCPQQPEKGDKGKP